MLQLNVGQAGGQLGSGLCRILGPASPAGWGTVFVDSEPKVVCPLIDDTSAARIPFLTSSSIVFDHNGRGNNWAWGYSSVASRQGIVADPKLGLPRGVRATLLDRSMLTIRRHAESMDRFDSLLLLHSTGGGTGSGFGCRLLESIRDEYGPKLCIVDTLVTPFTTGDTPLQHYNTVLTLAGAAEHADAIIPLSNDDLLVRARQARVGRASLSAGATPTTVASARAALHQGSKQAVSVADLNACAAEALAGILLPTRHRRALARYGSEDDKGAGGGDGRPAWVDVAQEQAQAASEREEQKQREEEQDDREEDDETGNDEEDDRYGERGGWIAASVRAGVKKDKDRNRDREQMRGRGAGEGGGSAGAVGRGGSTVRGKSMVQAILSASSIDQVLAIDEEGAGDGAGVGGGKSGGTSRPGTSGTRTVECPADLSRLVADLIVAPSLKLLDVRCVAPSASGPGERAPLPDSPASSWMALADHMAEAVKRYDAGGVRVTTHAARLMARGASQSDCDSVDPSLGPASARGQTKAGSTRGGSFGGRRERLAAAAPTLWPGLPSSPEWQRVSTVLTRALSWPGQGTGGGTLDMDRVRTAYLSPAPVYTAATTPSSLAHARTLTLASNSDVHVPTLVHAVTCAEQLLAVRAYVHWYERYGVGVDRLASAMEGVLDIVEAYRPGSTGASLPPPVVPRSGSPSGAGGLLSMYAAGGDQHEEDGETNDAYDAGQAAGEAKWQD